MSAYDPAGLGNTSACLLSLWAFQLALAGLASGPTAWLTRLVKGRRESSAPRRTVRKRRGDTPSCTWLQNLLRSQSLLGSKSSRSPQTELWEMSPAIKQRLLPALLHLLLEKWPQSAKNPHFLSFISPELTNISWTPGRRYPANIKTQLTLKDDFERDEGWSKHTLSNSLWWRSTPFSGGQTGRACNKQKGFCPYSTFLLFIPSWTVSVGTLMCNSVSTVEKNKKNYIKKWAQ